jgi:hypothetical protein
VLLVVVDHTVFHLDEAIEIVNRKPTLPVVLHETEDQRHMVCAFKRVLESSGRDRETRGAGNLNSVVTVFDKLRGFDGCRGVC